MRKRQHLWKHRGGPALIGSAVAAGLVLLCSPHALAGNGSTQRSAGLHTLQASITAKGSWSTNPLMTTSAHETLWGSTISPELVFGSATPLSRLNLGLGVDQNTFNQSQFNSTDVRHHGDLSYRSKSWTIGLQERVDYDTSRTSELTNYGLNPTVVRHTGISLSPSIAYNASVLDTLSVKGSYARSEYATDLLTDYETFTVTPSYAHTFDHKNTGILSVQARRYQTTRNNATRIDTINPSLGWRTVFSPNFSADASAGAQTAREYAFGNAVDRWTWEYTFSGGISFTGKQDTLRLSTARAQFPYGNGTEALQTSVTLAEKHQLNHLLALNFGASYLTSKYQAPTAGNMESLVDSSAGLTYRVLETFDLTAKYRYRYETLTNRDKTPQDNAVTLDLVYRPTPWTLLD